MVTFSQDELEYFVGEWTRANRRRINLWLVEQNDDNSSPPYQKPIADKDYNDRYADKIFDVFTKVVFVNRQCFLIDMEAENGATPAQKWNQAVFQTRAGFSETPGSNDVLNVTIEHEYTSNADINPPSTDSSTRTQQARYRFIYGADGEIHPDPRQDFISITEGGTSRYAPGYGFLPLLPNLGATGGNPHITLGTLTNKLQLYFNPKFKQVVYP